MTPYRPRHAARRRRVPRLGAGARLVGGLVVVVGSGLIAVTAAGMGPDLEVGGLRGSAEPPGAAGGAAEAQGIPVVGRPDRPAGSPAAAEPAAPSPPARVDIPAIGVSTGIERLGLDADGALGSPGDYGAAGWFAAGPQPGQPGPAVIAGHVDSRDGPAVFYRLGELAVGDEVLVAREDGRVVRFRVTARQIYPKDEFPTTAVYGPVPGPELRLITCDGAFDRASRQYVDNLVVYAERV